MQVKVQDLYPLCRCPVCTDTNRTVHKNPHPQRNDTRRTVLAVLKFLLELFLILSQPVESFIHFASHRHQVLPYSPEPAYRPDSGFPARVSAPAVLLFASFHWWYPF